MTTRYPKTLQEAIIHFSDKERAHTAMVELRWPERITCQHCGGTNHSFNAKRFVYQCRDCRKQFTVKTGSVMEDSPLGLDKWLSAMWLVANSKNGVSSCEIARSLGITQKSAWFLDHRIRLAMQQGTLNKFSGQVEADETFIGGKARNMHAGPRAKKIHGRGPSGKAVVFGLLERKSGSKNSRVAVKVVAGRKKQHLQPELREVVAEGSQLFTDALKSYDGMTEYEHRVVDHAERYVDGIVHTNGMENFWALLKRCLIGTYISVEPYHLFRYADEEAFRFNERQDTDQGRFKKVAGGVAGKRITYKQLTGKVDATGV